MSRYCDLAKDLSFKDIAIALHRVYQTQAKATWYKANHGLEYIYLEDGLYLFRGMCGELYLEKGGNPFDVSEKINNRCIEIQEAGMFVNEEA